MKERQRWTAEEDALLRAYVKHYGPREWNLVSQRMNKPLNRDAKSCLERWKNYLKPGIKKGSLTEEEKSLVIRLQQIYGNKWKKIAAEVPGRTAKRLGKWWEVFKEKQQREKKEINKTVDPIDDTKYDHILETFAEKLVKERPSPSYLMAASSGALILTDATAPPSAMLPSWLSNSNSTLTIRPPSPSVTLSLSPSPVAAPPPVRWLQPEKMPENTSAVIGNVKPHGTIPCFGDNMLVSELVGCCKELEEGHRAWSMHRKETAWRLRRVELQLESEKACRVRQKMEEFEAKIKSLREEQMAALDRMEAEYREQLDELRRDAETKEKKLAEQLAAKHSRLGKFLEQIGCGPKLAESNVR